MKKFRFLIFMLVLTSIFIGCAQPTDDPVIPEVPKTTNEAEPTDDQLYSLAKYPKAGETAFLKNFTIKSSNRKFTINTTLEEWPTSNTIVVAEWPIEYLNKKYTILISSFGPSLVIIRVKETGNTDNTDVTDECIKTIITNNIKQIYVEVK